MLLAGKVFIHFQVVELLVIVELKAAIQALESGDIDACNPGVAAAALTIPIRLDADDARILAGRTRILLSDCVVPSMVPLVVCGLGLSLRLLNVSVVVLQLLPVFAMMF